MFVRRCFGNDVRTLGERIKPEERHEQLIVLAADHLAQPIGQTLAASNPAAIELRHCRALETVRPLLR
jgi:hypothetical protein